MDGVAASLAKCSPVEGRDAAGRAIDVWTASRVTSWDDLPPGLHYVNAAVTPTNSPNNMASGYWFCLCLEWGPSGSNMNWHVQLAVANYAGHLYWRHQVNTPDWSAWSSSQTA